MYFCPSAYFQRRKQAQVGILCNGRSKSPCRLPTASLHDPSMSKKPRQRLWWQGSEVKSPCMCLQWQEGPKQNQDSTQGHRALTPHSCTRAGICGLPATPANYLPNKGGVGTGGRCAVRAQRPGILVVPLAQDKLLPLIRFLPPSPALLSFLKQ